MLAQQHGVAPPGFRLPAATAVGAVTLQVANLDRSLDFYTRILGFRHNSVTADSAELAPYGTDRALIRLRARPGARPVPRGGTMGLYHFAILLPDRRALGRCLVHLLKERIGPGMADHAVSEALYLSDPDGLGIEIYADRPASTWTSSANGELYLTTQAMDHRGVMAAADGEWTGIPQGTVIGHVHLHVGALQEAEDFYHRGVGLDKMVWSYPGALFLSAGGYHHHVGVNTWSTGGRAADDQARLLLWELLVPHADDADAAGNNLQASGYVVEQRTDIGGWVAVDPWGTNVHIRPSRG